MNSIQDISTFNCNEFADSPLKLFDELYRYVVDNKKSPLEQKIRRKHILRCILALGGKSDESINCEDEDVEALAKVALDNHDSLQNRALVGACYLRLLSGIDGEWTTIPPWRPKIILFLDSIFRDDLYKEWKIDFQLQAHEKSPRLQEIYKEQEKNIDQAIIALTSLDRISIHRKKLLEAINNRTGRILILPFLPGNIISLLSDIYDLIDDYLANRETINVIDIHSTAIKALEDFITTLQNSGFSYSLLLAEKVGCHLINLLEEDFVNNKAAQPANLSVEAKVKKYPLHLLDCNINLGLMIRNSGPGYAHDASLEVVAEDEKLSLSITTIDLGRIHPSESRLIKVPSIVMKECESVDIYATVKWKNFTGEERSFDLSTSLKAQRKDINWIQLAQTDPYSLEPVETAKQLVGRKEVINRLMGLMTAANTGSAIIHGQKRVGKTSIAKVIRSNLNNDGFIIIYLEAGDYVMPTASQTVKRLGNMLCKKLQEADTRLSLLQLPLFDEAFSPITDFLDEVHKYIPEKKVIIILDEFDMLPYELYARGAWGDSFFLTLRSITSRPHIGFLLVGGERMAQIMENQGVQLNKWTSIPVDYFLRETDWDDYKELIQRPVNESFEYSEEAFNLLHDLSGGNPYFTKLICQYVFRAAVSSHDGYISTTEIDQILDKAIFETAENAFQHFWDDRIFESGEKATEISIRRRKILIGISDSLQKENPATGKLISEHPLLKNLPTLESDLREFLTRKVLQGEVVGGLADHNYSYKVKFFQLWLKNKGVQDLIATFPSLDAALKERQQEEQLRVRADEVVKLVKTWNVYKGQSISSEEVRAWIDQFVTIKEQRLMFKILQGLRFYSNSYLRGKMLEAHSLVTRGLGRSQSFRQVKRSDFLVSYLDSVGKSGASFARLYADEAKIYTDNIIERSKLLTELEKRKDIKVLLFLDDFVGTGQQASKNLREITTSLRDILISREIKVVFIPVVAINEGWKYLCNEINKIDIPIEIHYCELLDDSERFFTENSKILSEPGEREAAKDIAIRNGRILLKDNPLGFGNLGIAVVFEHGCPNDTLPIIWAESGSPRWTPLFKRL